MRRGRGGRGIVRLDPDAPNAYIGRATARRSLGDEAGALDDERTARELGGPERSAWDRLANRSIRRWRGELDDPAWRATDPLSRQAVLLRQLNGQVLNGGLHQWISNGYAAWVDDVAESAGAVGTPPCGPSPVEAIVPDGPQTWHPEEIPEDDEIPEGEEEALGQISRCGRYYRVAEAVGLVRGATRPITPAGSWESWAPSFKFGLPTGA